MSSINIFEGNYALVNCVRLHFASAGEPSRPLILFLHGFPEFWYAWNRQLAEFGATHFAVAPDMRGYNRSSKPDDVCAYAVKHLVEDVCGLARQLGCAGRFTLVGHDWGGAVAWAFAIAHPEPLERLVIDYYRAARIGPPVAGEPAASIPASGDLRVMVPTLVIWGERDHARLPGNLNGLDAFVPDLRIERIPEGSHWVVHEKPQEVNRFLRQFIAG